MTSSDLLSEAAPELCVSAKASSSLGLARADGLWTWEQVDAAVEVAAVAAVVIGHVDGDVDVMSRSAVACDTDNLAADDSTGG